MDGIHDGKSFKRNCRRVYPGEFITGTLCPFRLVEGKARSEMMLEDAEIRKLASKTFDGIKNIFQQSIDIEKR
jgi:hypothetical protein